MHKNSKRLVIEYVMEFDRVLHCVDGSHQPNDEQELGVVGIEL